MKHYLEKSIDSLIKEQNQRNLNSNRYLFEVGYSIYTRKIVNNKISEEEKATKTLFNSKNKLFTYEYFRKKKKYYVIIVFVQNIMLL